MQTRAMILAASALAAFLSAPIAAQDAQPSSPATEQARQLAQRGERPEAARPDAPRRPAERQVEGRRLPADAVTQHALALPGRTLRFTATAGALPLVDPQGQLQAEIGFVAYTREAADPGTRPVTFALNGGPGAASAYLHLGVLGPWRLPLDGPSISPSTAPALVPNAETWLDFTDLVFLDPVDTGYSRAAGSGEEARERYFTVDGDIASIAAAVARWLRVNGRLASPKFYVGESYGGFRGPRLAQQLQKEVGVGMSGLVLLSPVLDFGWFSQPRHAPWTHVARLPSYAAAALEGRGPVDRAALGEAERYAAREYLTDLMRGLQDAEAVERVSRRVAALTGLDPEVVRRRAGRVDVGTFQRELRRGEKRIVSAYDTGVSGHDPDPSSASAEHDDPGLTAMTAPLTSAMIDHLSRTLEWRVADQRYALLNGSVNGAWRWSRGRGQPESLSHLRQALALDQNLHVLIVHGFTDLVTPYFASQLLIDQLPRMGSEPRVTLAVYPGGHMFYSRDASRIAFREDALRLYRGALEARQRAP